VTIQMTVGKSQVMYKVNEWNSREIDWRYNRKNARWYRFKLCETPEQARLELLALQREGDGTVTP
jgi:hypothetical protein